MTRFCTKCERALPLEAFSRHKNGKDGLRHHCRDCCNLIEKRRREANPEPLRAAAREYARTHREANIARARRWHQKHRDAALRGFRDYYLTHKDRFREYSLRSRTVNRERYLERARLAHHKRRMSPEAFGYAKIVLNDPCSYCGAPATSVDHIVPVNRMGDNDWMNLTGACASCNSRKQDKSLLSFLLRR